MRASRALAACLAAPLGACSLLVDLDVGVRDPVEDGDAGSGDDDGGSGDAGVDDGPCGSVARLQDAFTSAPLSSRWIARKGGAEATDPAIDGDGKLSLEFSSVPTTDGQFTEVESRFAYDLRGHAVTVWSEAPDDRAWSTLEVREAGSFASSRRIIALGRKGTVFAAFVRTPAEQVIRQVVFDGSQRYWRIREVAGSLEFEVAAGDQVFSPFTTLELPGIDLDTVMIGLAMVGSTSSTGTPASRFDDLDAGEEADPACRVARLMDDFAAGELGPLWIDESDGCALTTGDGLTATASAGGRCEVNSAHAYSVVGGGELVVELADLPVDPDAVAEIRLAHDDDNYLAIQQQDGELDLILVEDGAGGTPITLPNPVASQWWRVRERDGELDVATAPDGSSFSPRGSVAAGGLDLSELRVTFLLRVNAASSARLGGVNQTR